MITEELAEMKLAPLQSIEEADQALLELRQIEHRMQALNDACERARQEVVQSFASQMVTDKGVPYSMRKSQLLEQLQKFAISHRPQICPGDKKSVALVNGLLGFRKAPDSVEVDKEPPGWMQRLTKAVINVLLSFKVHGFEAGSYFNANLRIDKARVLNAHKTLQLTDAQLQHLGCKVVEGRDEFYLKLYSDPLPTA